jgi:RNA polymerase sigma-70 factor (ECF subfamily)
MTELERDAELLWRVRQGDKSACEECIRVHSPGVYRLALRLMRDPSEAEDVMQDAFLSAFKGIESFDGRSTLRTWLYRIAYNAAMMRLRKRQPEFVSLDDAPDLPGGWQPPRVFHDWSSAPDQELETAEVRDALERAVQELPPTLRAAFVMRELEELSTAETAAALGLSEDAVKTRLHRARLWLRERLSGHFAHLARNTG